AEIRRAVGVRRAELRERVCAVARRAARAALDRAAHAGVAREVAALTLPGAARVAAHALRAESRRAFFGRAACLAFQAEAAARRIVPGRDRAAHAVVAAPLARLRAALASSVALAIAADAVDAEAGPALDVESAHDGVRRGVDRDGCRTAENAADGDEE